jgi:hypothetical protein
MPNDPERPTLDIDGTVIPINAVWLHHQRFPDASGHRYCLHLPEPIVALLAERVGSPIISTDRVDDAFADELLYWLSSVFAALPEFDVNDPTETQYVINSIHQIVTRMDGSIGIRGSCATFLRGTRKGSESNWPHS